MLRRKRAVIEAEKRVNDLGEEIIEMKNTEEVYVRVEFAKIEAILLEDIISKRLYRLDKYKASYITMRLSDIRYRITRAVDGIENEDRINEPVSILFTKPDIVFLEHFLMEYYTEIEMYNTTNQTFILYTFSSIMSILSDKINELYYPMELGSDFCSGEYPVKETYKEELRDFESIF